ncbi:NAD(P) transhydrogenase subunit alpha part 1 [Candidatus Zixiibacteriota bacterium]|nr:NAD(P) transhydrogenase subunit alpha part 1 [candidate division Zixibacteria bacterium]
MPGSENKTITIGVPQETFPGEARVALIPDHIPPLVKAGMNVMIEKSTGTKAGFPDHKYTEKGASLAPSREELFKVSDVILQIRGLGANPENWKSDVAFYRRGQWLIGFFEPLAEPEEVARLAPREVTAFSMELMPRITRAQSMDALSSMATIAGYKAVLIAANTLPRMFPMSMTAAGTLTPAKVFVIGAGVAGLQAIAMAHRLGAMVKGYDIRPAVKEQVESLGAKFVELPLETSDSEDKGGYAKAMDEEFYRKQRALLAQAVADSHVVITTALVPGKQSPILITKEMVEGMAPGSVIIDLAAEKGGNCALTQPDKTIVINGVTIIGPVNIASSVPFHASQMYSKNIVTFLQYLLKDGKLAIDPNDEIVRETMVTRSGQIVNSRLRETLEKESASKSANG